jgi:serine/threonine protein phosphatase PrpC
VQQVTEDHTVFNELIKRGKLSREQIEKVAQKNAITRAVGVYERVEVDTLAIEVLPATRSSSRATGCTATSRRPTSSRAPRARGGRGGQGLIKLANDRGGKDNITAVIVKLGEEGATTRPRARLALKREVLAKMPLFARLTERELCA